MTVFPGLAETRRRGIVEFAAVVVAHALLSTVFTYPLAARLTTVSYKIHAVGDAQYSVWNVAWVAHALLTDPLHVLDANIFYPERGTLIYSEPNLLAGVLGAPVYWWTGGNPYATLNSVVLLSFVLSGTASYYLVRYLIHDRRAAMVAAICFAYCPYVFSRFAHIQLLLTAPMPLAFLAFHRLADRPALGRGLMLGIALGLQALACGYYGVFLVTLIGPLIVVTAVTQNLVKNARFWAGLCVAGLTSTLIVAPLFAQYLALQSGTGFGRSLENARVFSATWRTYLVSGAYASSWLTDGSDAGAVLFPGFVAGIGGVVGLAIAWRLGGRPRQLAAFYGTLALLAFWLSLGPSGYLYSIAYRSHSVFTMMRAPNRFGVLVSFALSVAASFAIAPLLRRVALPALVCTVLGLVATAEHLSPLRFTAVPTIAPAYQLLATQPAGAVLELPLFSRPHGFSRTHYMLNSTAHWKPLVNGYSDHIPSAFSTQLPVLADFPTAASFDTLPLGVRYAIFHLDAYKGRLHEVLVGRLHEFRSRLRLLYADDDMWLYEIVAPPAPEISYPDSMPPL